MLTEEQGEWAARLRATGLRPPYALGCILRFLLKPNAEVRQLLSGLERELHAPGSVAIGVHIRFTDGTVWEGEGEDGPKQLSEGEVERLKQVARPLLQCAQSLEDWWFAPPLEVRWLIITNSLHFKLAMHHEYQNKVVSTPFTPRHSNKLSDNAISTNATLEVVAADITAYQELVADWLLLSTCHSFVVPRSGYSRTAAFFSLRPNSVFSVETGFCDPEGPVNMFNLAHSWSGL
ncbi:hypothetical protein CLOM_g21638 [Closterium sp. NIES-68]|nr:hypothetical protein CLOM_g21638 [Closterium sp. NIES-68]GJP73013.1 hypothetical protein CLOP_g3775 [Closterium sp. NIES-67]